MRRSLKHINLLMAVAARLETVGSAYNLKTADQFRSIATKLLTRL
jgi:hypothetical protein